MAKVLFFDIDDVLFDTDNFIKSNLVDYKAFNDAKEVIKKIKKIKIAILSKGEREFQKQKLIKTGLSKYFNEEETYIVNEKGRELKQIFDKYKHFEKYILDDRIDNLEKIKKNDKTVRTILIKRGRYRNLESNFIPDFTIKNLGEILNIIND